jgi:hypothetical protein
MMPTTKEQDATELAEIRNRTEVNELKARDFEAQLRVIEARTKLNEAQNKFKQAAKEKVAAAGKK